MQRPTLRQLEYLVAVAERRHFGRAAEACGVTQPGLSAQLQQLEELLGVQLVERARRQVVLTAPGERAARRARAILRDADDLVEEAIAARDPLSGPLRLGAIPTIAPYLLPRVLPAARRAWPDLRLLLREERTDDLLASLRAGAVDLALVALPVDDAELETMELFSEPFCAAFPARDPLAEREVVEEADLAGREVLLLEDGHCLRDQALSVCVLAGAAEPLDASATSLPTLVQMVASGLGMTLLPLSAVEIELGREEAVVSRPLAARAASRRVGLVWRQSSARREGFASLGERIAAAARAELPQLDPDGQQS